MIKEYFANYFLHMSDVTFDMRGQPHGGAPEARRALAGDAGGHRRGLHDRRPPQARCRVRGVEEEFCFTYGDGVGDIDITRHARLPPRPRQGGHGDRHRSARAASARWTSRPDGSRASRRSPGGDGAWINGGFFVLSPEVLDYIDGDATVWEQEPLKRLASDGQLMAYEHHGFWQPMDTLRDKHLLESCGRTGKAPWKTWD